MRKMYLLPLCLSLLFSSINSWALGLGEITVSSKLGEKLTASVPISETTTLNAEQIKISNAPAEIYQQLNVDNSFIYQGFKLEISENNNKLILNISTKEPVKEPYLNFVLQIKWPNGQLNKEYKVFIDP